MRLTVSSTFYNFTLLLLSLVFVLLCAVSGSGRVPRAHVEGSLPSLHQAQNQTIRNSEPPTPDDPQVKTVLDKMAAAGIALPTTVADVRKAYLFYPKLSGTPESVFRIQDREVPGPAGNIPSACILLARLVACLSWFSFMAGGSWR